MQNRSGLLDTDVMPIFMIIALNIVITLCFSINCSVVICLPTIEIAILREATSETYAPRVYLPSYQSPGNVLFLSSFILQSLLFNLYKKYQKYLSYYLY